MKSLLTGRAYWSYDHELADRSPLRDSFLSHISGIPPFHAHEGEIILTDCGLFISGDTDLTIPFDDLEIFMGFDETFPRSLVKNLGMFWQPLRLQFTEGFSRSTIYLIIDYNWLGTSNKLWFNALKDIAYR